MQLGALRAEPVSGELILDVVFQLDFISFGCLDLVRIGGCSRSTNAIPWSSYRRDFDLGHVLRSPPDMRLSPQAAAILVERLWRPLNLHAVLQPCPHHEQGNFAAVIAKAEESAARAIVVFRHACPLARRSRDNSINAGLVPVLVQLARRARRSLPQHALGLLSDLLSLVIHDDDSWATFKICGVGELLADMVETGSAECQSEALKSISGFCDKSCRAGVYKQLDKLGVVSSLVRHARDGADDEKEYAFNALAGLLEDDPSRLFDPIGIHLMVGQMRRESASLCLRQHATAALAEAVVHRNHAAVAVEAGAFRILALQHECTGFEKVLIMNAVLRLLAHGIFYLEALQAGIGHIIESMLDEHFYGKDSGALQEALQALRAERHV